MSKMAGIAETQAQADADLKSLREARGISEPGSALISSLDSALKMYAGLKLCLI